MPAAPSLSISFSLSHHHHIYPSLQFSPLFLILPPPLLPPTSAASTNSSRFGKSSTPPTTRVFSPFPQFTTVRLLDISGRSCWVCSVIPSRADPFVGFRFLSSSLLLRLVDRDSKLVRVKALKKLVKVHILKEEATGIDSLLLG